MIYFSTTFREIISADLTNSNICCTGMTDDQVKVHILCYDTFRGVKMSFKMKSKKMTKILMNLFSFLL